MVPAIEMNPMPERALLAAGQLHCSHLCEGLGLSEKAHCDRQEHMSIKPTNEIFNVRHWWHAYMWNDGLWLHL